MDVPFVYVTSVESSNFIDRMNVSAVRKEEFKNIAAFLSMFC